MKNVYPISIILCLAMTSSAQQYDKVWAVGSPVSTMTFQGDSVRLNNLPDSSDLSFITIGNICDHQGNFLFFSNGLAVYNRFGNIMPHGDSLNFPSEYYYQEIPQGGASLQGVVILPKPNDTNLYYIFHYTSTDTLLTYGGYESTNLYYSIVDLRLDSGRGDLIQKNVPIIQNTLLSASRLAAVRHANGRDWWIIKPVWHLNTYYSFLLTPDSLIGPFSQSIGMMYGNDNELPAYSVFSPEGSKYVSVTTFSYVVIMDFDRCTGLFSNPDTLFNNDNYPYSSANTGGNALAFSPSGRFLYVGDPIEINQYDLWSSHPHDSVIIAIDTESYQMNIMQLASNGKIYVSCWNGGSYAMHVINNPDSFGRACDFQLLSQPVLSANSVALPYFPNFKLGPLIGSGCDTITGINPIPPPYAMVKIEPNPASDHVYVIYQAIGTNNEVNIYDALGNLVIKQSDPGNTGKIPIDTRQLPAGIYTIQVTSDSRNCLNTKLVVMH